MEISGPILDDDDFERTRRHVHTVSDTVTHVLVVRPFGKVGITATQLTLRPGDVVEVLARYPVGYWRGRCGGKEGIFDVDCCVACTPEGKVLDGEQGAEEHDDHSYMGGGGGQEGGGQEYFFVGGGGDRGGGMVVDDAETSESEGGSVKTELRRAVLRRASLMGGSAPLLPSVATQAEDVEEDEEVGVMVTPLHLPASPKDQKLAASQPLLQIQPDPQKKRPGEDEEDSVSVSIDPHLLDSIGESPRGVMRMIGSAPRIPRVPSGTGASFGRASSPSNTPPRGSYTESEVGPSTIVRLNIGGKRFTTTLPTLKKYQDSMLAVMFSGRFAAPSVDQEGYFFIDRDGKYFRYILNFLRDGTVVLPDDPRQRKEILKEAIYYQLPQLVKDILKSGSRGSVQEYLTVRYLPGSTYDGWPIRIEGGLGSEWVKELNGGDTLPPEKETDDGVRNMFGRTPVWKMRGVFLTSIFNVLSHAGWKLATSNGSGAGIEPKITFAELYVFSRVVYPKHDSVQTISNLR